jgi:hypothetical protein
MASFEYLPVNNRNLSRSIPSKKPLNLNIPLA